MQFFVDLTLLGIFVIGLTAFMGVITHFTAAKIFGRKNAKFFFNKSKNTQTGWRKVQRRT